jgi:hypothetical protein
MKINFNFSSPVNNPSIEYFFHKIASIITLDNRMLISNALKQKKDVLKDAFLFHI